MTPDIVSESVDMCFDLSAAHRNEVFLKIENLHRNKTFCDVKLIIGEKIIWVHKLLLVASLPYFHSMFTHDLIEKQQESIILKDMDPLAVELIIEFVYTSKININQNNVQTLLRVSTILQVSLVQEKCCEFLEKQLDPSNCLGIYTFAELHGCIELKMKAKNYCDRHFSKVVKEEEFLSLPFERVRWFLDQNELCVRTKKRFIEQQLIGLNKMKVNECPIFHLCYLLCVYISCQKLSLQCKSKVIMQLLKITFQWN